MSLEFSAGVADRDIMPPIEIINNSLHSSMALKLDETGSPLKVKALATARSHLSLSTMWG